MRWFPSLHELAQAAVGLLGIGLISLTLAPGWTFYAGALLGGLAFEVALKPLWTFHPALRDSRFTVRGVNLFVGVAWVGLVSLGLVGASALEHRTGWSTLLSLIIAFGCIGNLVETLFARMGALEYRLDHRLLAFPFTRAPVILGVPLAIRTGYWSTLPLAIWGVTVPS